MKNLVFTLLACLMVFVSAFGQLDIVLHEIDPGYYANEIAEDDQGNILVASAGEIKKLSPDGATWIWTTSIVPVNRPQIREITADGTGHIYLVGRYSNSIQLGSITLTSLSGTVDIFAAKMDPDGNFLWATSFGGSIGTDEADDIALDASGNVYIAGTYCNKKCGGGGAIPGEIHDIYVARLNNAGTAVWQKRFPPSKIQCGNDGYAYAIAVDNTGNVYASGSFSGTFKFGNSTALTLTGQADVFTIKLNSSGTALWAKAGNGAAGDRGQSLYIDAGGNVNVGGYFGLGAGNISFAPFTLADMDGNGGAPGPLVSNAFLVQYSSAGTINWAINPSTVTGARNEVKSIIAGPAGTIRIFMPLLGIKCFSTAGAETESIALEDNFTPVDGYPYPKTILADMEAAASGFIVAGTIRCGTVTMANLLLENQHCQNCADWYTCDAPNHADLYILRSASPPAVNAPIISRSTPEILGHTYLGTFNGHTYYLSDCWTTWIQAHEAATEMGGYLATITSQDEDCFLAQLPGLYYEVDDYFGGAWIGLLAYEQNDSCDYWQWVNGESFVYENWESPNSYVNNYPIVCGQPVLIGYSGDFSYPPGHCVSNFGWVRHPDVSWEASRYIVEFDSDPGCSQAGKTYVCHNGNTLCINESALQSHLNHGDYAGSCGPCNATYAGAPSVISDYTTTNAVPVSIGKDNQQDHFGKEPVSGLDVYPNPASDEINIRFDHSISDRIIIYDLFGSLIWSGPSDPFTNQIQIRLDDRFTDGVYVLHAIQEGRQVVKRFVVSR